MTVFGPKGGPRDISLRNFHLVETLLEINLGKELGSLQRIKAFLD
jgi:hypothetical protein